MDNMFAGCDQVESIDIPSLAEWTAGIDVSGSFRCNGPFLSCCPLHMQLSDCAPDACIMVAQHFLSVLPISASA